MKFINGQYDRKRMEDSPNKYYTVRSPRNTVTSIDNYGNIVDNFPFTFLVYKIEEAEDLLKFLKTTWPDYSLDPYYGQGIPIYPIIQKPSKIEKVEKMPYKRNIMTYRYQQAGEWIYGITNKWMDDPNCKHNNIKAVEAPMDGWEKWLYDRQQMLKDKELAETIGNL